ncbi:hypothetical protein GQ55_6G268500 [Panicum hallii var. hallii]|uniref:Uncharacterized protein n=1 Tax=Panicum hallii var. hallii TaxID=1504633 RepID=A0A2T7D9Z8_9POAL|nr:hypothetical protein GQ55_6G268500 [Panicum hallii var. hallii]
MCNQCNPVLRSWVLQWEHLVCDVSPDDASVSARSVSCSESPLRLRQCDEHARSLLREMLADAGARR